MARRLTLGQRIWWSIKWGSLYIVAFAIGAIIIAAQNMTNKQIEYCLIYIVDIIAFVAIWLPIGIGLIFLPIHFFVRCRQAYSILMGKTDPR